MSDAHEYTFAGETFEVFSQVTSRKTDPITDKAYRRTYRDAVIEADRKMRQIMRTFPADEHHRYRTCVVTIGKIGDEVLLCLVDGIFRPVGVR